MDNSIRTARSPVVRARLSTLGFVRGRLYEVRPRFVEFTQRYTLVVCDEFGGADVSVNPRMFTPANRVAARLLAPPVSADVKRYRRRVLRELRALANSLHGAAESARLNKLFTLAEYLQSQASATDEAIAAVRRVRP